MDHRVAKDMISSGMIPSGEKKKEDLSRTQYGSAPSPNALLDAYKSMYDKKEEVINEHHKKDADGNTIPHEGEEVNEGKIPAGLQAYLDKKKGKKEDKKEVKEGADLFDVISIHFINEGYEEKDVYKAMASLTEDQLQNLDEALPAVLAALPAIAGKLATGAAVAGKTAVAAGTKGLMAAGKGLAVGGQAAMKGVVSAAKPVVKSATAVKDLAGKGLTSAKDIAGKGLSNVGQQVKKVVNPKPPANKISPTSPSASGEDRLKRLKDFAKRETGNVVRQKVLQGVEPSGTDKTKQASAQKSNIAASADLFDIIKGQLLDEGLSEEEIKDIMLTLTPDEILKEIEESSMSAGSSGGHYHDGGDGVFRSKEQIGNMFNKNIPTKKQTGGKVDKMTRKSINTSARELGIQGPTTLKQSVEPEGETI